jgi:hypothetical protein
MCDDEPYIRNEPVQFASAKLTRTGRLRRWWTPALAREFGFRERAFFIILGEGLAILVQWREAWQVCRRHMRRLAEQRWHLDVGRPLTVSRDRDLPQALRHSRLTACGQGPTSVNLHCRHSTRRQRKALRLVFVSFLNPEFCEYRPTF